jgi:hypothetical protein
MLSLALILATTGIHAEYYTLVDSEGNVHFTDNPASLPSSVRKRVQRVDVEMGPEKKSSVPSSVPERDESEQSTRPVKRAKKAVKQLKKIIPMVGVPAAAYPLPSRSPANVRTSFPNTAVVHPPDPVLATPLMTLQHFRHSVVAGDYSAAAACLGLVDAGEARAYLTKLPKELADMLSEESSPAVETVRDNDRAVYMIGDPRTAATRVKQRYEVTLQRAGMNWLIMH